MALRLNIVIGSTRPGRIGPALARWLHGVAEAEGGFDARLVDLAEFDLPLFDEPRHPRAGRYERDHTRRWSESVAAADAFAFVAPEYNHGPSPALLNALDFLYGEWARKPAALVSYGGGSGGLRAAQALKLSLLALRVVPIVESVSVRNAAAQVADGAFTPDAAQAKAAPAMLAELRRWAEALAPLRA